MDVYFCRTCALKMYDSNKGFDYRCAGCHEKAEGWCQMWEAAVVNEAWKKIWQIKELWRDGTIDGDEAMYEIETIMDEVGE